MKTIITSPLLPEDCNLVFEFPPELTDLPEETFEKVLDSVLEGIRYRLSYLNQIVHLTNRDTLTLVKEKDKKPSWLGMQYINGCS